MNFNEYREAAITTAIHDTREKALTCFLLGMFGEWYEFYEKLIHADHSTEAIKKELGDFLWYLAAFTHTVGVDLDTISVSFDDDKMFGEIAKIQERCKKVYRDKNWVFDEEDLVYIRFHAETIYGMLVDFCEHYRYNLSDVFQMNLEKLFSRKDRGVISGSGDER